MYNADTNISLDSCWMNAKDLKNKEIKSYNLYNNTFAKDEEPYGSLPPIVFDHVNLRGRPGYGLSDDYLIDVYSSLRNNPMSLTKDRSHIQLFSRTFSANPKLTGTPGDINKELDVLTGSDSRLLPPTKDKDSSFLRENIEPTFNKAIMEQQFDRFIPLVDCMKDIQDPEHIVPSWTRGGDDTRSYENKLKYSKV